jgi:predicted nucleic acid-binding protein
LKPFFDSNVLVYALSNDGDARSGLAQRLLAAQGRSGRLVLSVQVLLETYNVLTRKKRADPAVALAAVRLFSRHEIVAPSASSALLALELAARHGLSAWDALIVQAALDAGCDTLFSEDLQAGRRFGGLEVVDPFAPGAHEVEVGSRAASGAPPGASAAAEPSAAPAPRARRRPPAHPAPPARPASARRR